jgi:hypothetical protein
MEAWARCMLGMLFGLLLGLSAAPSLADALVDVGHGPLKVSCRWSQADMADGAGSPLATQLLEPSLLLSNRSARFGIVQQLAGRDMVTTLSRIHADDWQTTVAAVVHPQMLSRNDVVTVAVLDVCGQSVADKAVALERLYALALGFSPETRYRLVLCGADGSCDVPAEQVVRHPGLLTGLARQRLDIQAKDAALPQWKPVTMEVRLGANHVVDVDFAHDGKPVSGADVSVFSPPHFGCLATSDVQGRASCTLEDMHPHGPDHVHAEGGHFLVATYRGSIAAGEVAPPMTAVRDAQLNFRFATPLFDGERNARHLESLARRLHEAQAPRSSEALLDQ